MALKNVLRPYSRYLEANWRAQKKHDNVHVGPVAQAYSEGQYWAGLPKRNPYPPGQRHDEWQRGYDLGRGR